MRTAYDYYLFNKPYGVICQFSPQDDKPTLAAYIKNVSKDVYPVGRLDTDSEGLLLLTNDKSLNSQLLNPAQAHPRTYHVQVEGDITPRALAQLTGGLVLNDNGKMYTSRKALARVIETPAYLWERNPPVRFRKNIPTAWIALTLTEGKNRQVRKMTAAVGFPTLRLVRYAIGSLTLEDIAIGGTKQIDPAAIQALLRG